MGWLNFGGKKRDRAQGFGDSSKTKSRKRSKSFILEKIVTPSAGFGDWEHEFDHLHQLLGSFSLSDLHLPNFFADSGVCPIAPGAPTNNLPPLIDFDPLGLYNNGIATQTPYTPGGAFETLPIALIPVDPHSPNHSNPNAIRQLLNFPLASQPLVGSIDTGVSADSPYLNYANIKKGRDYVGGDDNPLLKPGEGSEHGTFMLGIVDAINKTAPKWVGRAIDSGRWADSLVEFVDAAKASGQKNAIANLSLDLTQKNADGSVTTRYELTPAERSAIEYARQNGVMLVVAAGNDGGVMSVLGQASQEFDNIFTVGAGDINGRSIYSSYGRGLDIVADGGTTEHPGLSTVGNDLGTMAGTSVATAKVAGAASLVWAANPALNYRQVMEILKSTARDLGPVGWDDETGFGFLNTLAAVDLAQKTAAEVYKPTVWVTPDTWSGQGKVTPEERAAKGGNSLAAATVQASSSFSDSDRVDSNQPEKYYQFTVTEPGYVSWNLTSLNPVSGFPTPPQVTVTKADGKPGSYTFFKGASLQTSVVGEGQTSFEGGNFYDPGTYYLKVGNGAGSSFKDYNISTQFIADRVSTFTGNIQYRTQPYYSLDNSLQSAVFSGPAVSELSNLSGVVTYDNIQFNNRIAKYGVEVNESGKIRINLNSPNGKMEVSVKKFIGSDDRPESIASLEVSANSDGWLELDLNKGRYDIEVKTPSNFWLEPDWNSTQQRLVRPYTLNATFTPNAPQPGQGKVPSSAGAFDKTVVSNGVVNHYYKNGYLTVQPSGQASWYGYGTGNAIGVIEISAVPLPFEIPPDYAGNLPNTARDIGTLIGTQTFHDVIDRNDRFDYYKFNITSESKVDFALSGKMGNTGFYLFQDWYFNSDDSTHIDRISGTPPGVVPEFSETLKPGTYYVLVHKPQDYDGDEYDLKLSAVPLDYAGNTLDNARIIPVDLTTKFFKDFVGQTDGDDYYRFDLQEERQVIMTLDGFSAGATVDLLKKVPSNGQLSQLARFDNGTDVKFLDGVLDAGTYYVRVAPNSTGANTNYNFNFSALRLASGWIDSHIIPINPEPSIPQWQKDIDNTYQSARNLLGNPTGSYGKTVSSLNGAQGYGRNYDYGTVYWSDQSGAIALWHDFANTYNENGSFSGWLGFPTKANENWTDGQRIDFEGGYIYWTEKEGAKAYRPWETPNTSTVNDGQTINRKPIINFPNFEMPYNGSFILQNYANKLQIADPDGDAIQFYEISVDPTRIDMEAWTLEGQPPGKFLIPADQFNTIKFYGSVLGSNPVLVRAFDGKEWSDSTSFNINVVASSNSGGVAITPGNGSAGSSGNTGNSGGGSSNNSTTNTNSGSNPIIFNNNYNNQSNFPLIYASSTNNLNKVVKVVPENFSGPLPFLSIRQGNVFGSIYYFNFLAKGISILVPDEPQLKNKTSWLKGELERNNLLGQFSDSQFGEITLLSGTPLSLFFTEDKVVFTSKLNDTVVRNNAKHTGTRSYQEAINRGILASSDYHYLSPEAFVEYLRAGTSMSSSLVETKKFTDAILQPSPMVSIETLNEMKRIADKEGAIYQNKYPNLWREFGAYRYILDSYSSSDQDLIKSMLLYLKEDQEARQFIYDTGENLSGSASVGVSESKTKVKYLENLFALSESYFKIQKEDPRKRNEITQQEFIKLALKLLASDKASTIYSLSTADDTQKELITTLMTTSASAIGKSIGGALGGPGGAVVGSFAADLAARYAAPLFNEVVNDAKKAISVLGNDIRESQIFNPFNSDYGITDWLFNPKYAFWNPNREIGNFKW